MREIKQYESAGRMILTGTPLHVGIPPDDHGLRYLIFTEQLVRTMVAA